GPRSGSWADSPSSTGSSWGRSTSSRRWPRRAAAPSAGLVLLDRGVGRGAEGLEHERDLVLLDELADHLDGLGRAVAVVVADEVDLAAVDPALVVDLLEVGRWSCRWCRRRRRCRCRGWCGRS